MKEALKWKSRFYYVQISFLGCILLILVSKWAKWWCQFRTKTLLNVMNVIKHKFIANQPYFDANLNCEMYKTACIHVFENAFSV